MPHYILERPFLPGLMVSSHQNCQRHLCFTVISSLIASLCRWELLYDTEMGQILLGCTGKRELQNECVRQVLSSFRLLDWPCKSFLCKRWPTLMAPKLCLGLGLSLSLSLPARPPPAFLGSQMHLGSIEQPRPCPCAGWVWWLDCPEGSVLTGWTSQVL